MLVILILLVIVIQITIIFSVYKKDIIKHYKLKKENKEINRKSYLISSMRGFIKSKHPKTIDKEVVNKVLKTIKERNIPYSFYEETGLLVFLKDNKIVMYSFILGIVTFDNERHKMSIEELLNWI